jgi:hypothetical protein
MGAVPLWIIELHSLVQMRPGGGQLAAREQGGPQRVVGLEQKIRGLEALGQAEELLPQRPPRLIFSSLTMSMPEPEQHTEKLQRLSHLLTQLAGAGVQPFHFWGRLALGDSQRRAEDHLHAQRLLAALVRLWQRGEQV